MLEKERRKEGEGGEWLQSQLQDSPHVWRYDVRESTPCSEEFCFSRSLLSNEAESRIRLLLSISHDPA